VDGVGQEDRVLKIGLLATHLFDSLRRSGDIVSSAAASIAVSLREPSDKYEQVDRAEPLTAPALRYEPGNPKCSTTADLSVVAILFVANYDALLFGLRGSINVLLCFVFGVPRCIFYFAQHFLGFAFHLLYCTLNLGLAIASPFAHLTFNAPCRIVDCAFHSVLVHFSTSVDL
jgi:hypothetical protein